MRHPGWSLAPMVALAVPAPAYAALYLTSEQALRNAFPTADAFASSRIALSPAQWQVIDSDNTAPVAERDRLLHVRRELELVLDVVGREHRAGGDAEEEGVADLTGGAPDGWPTGRLATDTTPASEALRPISQLASSRFSRASEKNG